MHELVSIACDLLEIDPSEVLSSRVYDDRVMFVVRAGHKLIVPRDELTPPEPVVVKVPEVNATTEARAYARMHGVDLSTVQGTGRGGRILVRDVRKAING